MLSGHWTLWPMCRWEVGGVPSSSSGGYQVGQVPLPGWAWLVVTTKAQCYPAGSCQSSGVIQRNRGSMPSRSVAVGLPSALYDLPPTVHPCLHLQNNLPLLSDYDKEAIKVSGLCTLEIHAVFLCFHTAVRQVSLPSVGCLSTMSSNSSWSVIDCLRSQPYLHW